MKAILCRVAMSALAVLVGLTAGYLLFAAK